jgi:hypothetical protein
MKHQNNSNFRKSLVAWFAVISIAGSLTYLGLDGLGGLGSGPEKTHEPASPKARNFGLALGDGTGGAQQPAPAAGKGEPGVGGAPAKVLLTARGPVEGVPLPSAGMNPDADKGRVVRLNPASFVDWVKVSQGEKVALPSLTGEELHGIVNLVVTDPGWHRMGGTLDGRDGTFHLDASVDQIRGAIYFPDSGVGYQIGMDGSDVVLVERRLSALICYPGIKADTQGSRKAQGDVSPASGTRVIPQINTRPGARGVIYVDFAGGLISSTAWNGGRPINAAPSSLNADQIRQVLARAAESYAPFDVTLTTIRSVYDATPLGRRMRAVVTSTTTAAPSAGGVAQWNSWKWGGSDAVCWVFNQNVKSCADTIAHEVGHTLGLKHHGTVTGRVSPEPEYYPGHGGGLSVPTSWGPIMGAPFSVNLTQWSRGEYFNANNTLQDDLRVIAPDNNFGLVVSSGSFGAARGLPLNGNQFQASGTLVSQADSNVYQFATTGGRMSATVRPTSSVGTGDFKLSLENADGTAVVVSDLTEALGASITQTLGAGVYRLRVTSAGTGPAPTGGYRSGYSGYGSLGGYTLTGSVESASNPPAFLTPKVVTGIEGRPMSVGFEVADPARTTVSVLAQKLPGSLVLSAGSGTFGAATKLVLSGTPETGASNGVWSLTLAARNGGGETRMEFSVVVSPQSLPLSDALLAAGTTARITNVATSPTSPWTGVLGTRPDGKPGVIAQSGATPDNGTSLIQYEFTPPSASNTPWSLMTFFWQSDTEAGKDIVQCRVDGVLARDVLTGQPLALSGKRGWVQQTVLLPGKNTRRIEFAYAKDANLRSDVDRVWVCGIDVWQPPVITKSPVPSLRVTPGTASSSGTFSLSVEVLGAKTLQWHKNGVPLKNGTSVTGSIVSGADSPTLTISGAKAGDAGVYWMVAMDEKGATAVSTRCEVSVWVPPVVTTQPVAPTGLKVGDPLILTAQVNGAQPMFFQWRKDGVPGRWSLLPTLTINSTTAASAGKYVLVAVGPTGTVSSQEVTVSFAQSAVKAEAPRR